MPVKIRLQRHGRRGNPFFWIVAADSRAKRDGKFLEKLGTYNPTTNPAKIELDVDGAVKWLRNGAQPSETTRRILSYKGALLKHHLLRGVDKGALTEAQVEEKLEAWLEEKSRKIEGKKEYLAKTQAEARAKVLEAEKEVSEKRKATAKTPEEGQETAQAGEETATAAEAETPVEAVATEEKTAEAPVAEAAKEPETGAQPEVKEEKAEAAAKAEEEKPAEAPQKEDKKEQSAKSEASVAEKSGEKAAAEETPAKDKSRSGEEPVPAAEEKSAETSGEDKPEDSSEDKNETDPKKESPAIEKNIVEEKPGGAPAGETGTEVPGEKKGPEV